MKTQASKKNRRPWEAAVGVSLSAAAIVWLVNSIEGGELAERLRNVNLFFVVTAIALTALSYVLRSWRWPYFFDIRPPSFADSFYCLMIGFFMNNILPARMGEFVRAHLGGRVTNQSRTTVLASIAGERLIDGLTISVIFSVLFAIGSSPAEQREERGVYYVAYLFLGASLVTVLLLLGRDYIFAIIEQLKKLFPQSAAVFALERIRRFIKGLEPMLVARKMIVILPSSLLIWLVELLVYYQVTLAFDFRLSLGGLSLFLAAVNFSSLIPSAPAGAGTIEAAATTALWHIGVPRETALAMVLTQHIIQFAVVGIPGVFLFFLRLRGHLPVEELDR